MKPSGTPTAPSRTFSPPGASMRRSSTSASPLRFNTLLGREVILLRPGSRKGKQGNPGDADGEDCEQEEVRVLRVCCRRSHHHWDDRLPPRV